MPDRAGLAERSERHRSELLVHCYRMLASLEEAEEVVQETMLRAWRHRDDLGRPEHLRAWLYRIATNACLDHLRARKRRAAVVDSFRDLPWLEPFPDRLLPESGPGEPAGTLIERETIALTFVAMIQLLPPRQRAVLVLRQLLDWPAADVAETLGVGVAAVNSALQRARATLREHLPAAEREAWPAPEVSASERDVLERFMAAHESGDPDEILALVADDIRVTMPPAPYLFEGRDAFVGLLARAKATGPWRLLPTAANRQPAAGCYRRGEDGVFRAYKIDVLTLAGGRISQATTFGVKHFPAFALPDRLD